MPYTIYSSASFQGEVGSETSYNLGSGTSYGALGVQMSIDAFTAKNQYEPLYQLAQRSPINYYTKGHQMSVNTKFVLAEDNKNWLNFILQNNGSGTYQVGNVSSGFATVYGGGKSYTASGLVFDGATLSFEEGKTVDVSMNATGANLTMGTTAITPTYPSSFVTWTSATINGITQPVNKMTLNIDNAPALYYGLGSVEYVTYIPLKFKVHGSLDIYHDADIIDTILSAPSNTVTINAGNYTFTISGLYYDTGEINIVPVTTVMDKLTFVGNTITIS